MPIDWARVDLDAPWQPWTPQVGDRVRISVSGECRASNQPDSPLSRAGVTTGHAPEEDGMTGTVVGVSNDHRRERHPYRVWFDRQVFVGGSWCNGDYYAPAELELLEPER